jgi:hypothetical protein
MHLYPRIGVPFIGQNIVVPSHEVYVQVGQVVPPFTKKVQLLIVMAVKEVPHDEEVPGSKKLQEVHEPRQIFLIDFLWNRDPGFTEMARFSQVAVGDHHRVVRFPINSAVRCEPELFSGDLQWCQSLHPATNIGNCRGSPGGGALFF